MGTEFVQNQLTATQASKSDPLQNEKGRLDWGQRINIGQRYKR